MPPLHPMQTRSFTNSQLTVGEQIVLKHIGCRTTAACACTQGSATGDNRSR